MSPSSWALDRDDLEQARVHLETACVSGQVESAQLVVQQQDQRATGCFGKSTSLDDLFLIASISKPISVAAALTLVDRGELQLDDPLQKYLPQFTGAARDQVTIAQLCTHSSGLPDQLPENQSLRKRHAALNEFVAAACQTPLRFSPGAAYGYSSMGILLLSAVAEAITDIPFPQFVKESVFQPLGMQRSVLGMSGFPRKDLVDCQVAAAAREAGAGDPEARDWDWNSDYWRSLAAPWGGAHASAGDVAKFLHEFLHPTGRVLHRQTAKRMVENQLPARMPPRGLGFALGPKTSSRHCSAQAFGHGGSTGTLAWADPATKTICVVLTSLPATATKPHPRQLVADAIAQAAKLPH